LEPIRGILPVFDVTRGMLPLDVVVMRGRPPVVSGRTVRMPSPAGGWPPSDSSGRRWRTGGASSCRCGVPNAASLYGKPPARGTSP
jgi:hypothetical protein